MQGFCQKAIFRHFTATDSGSFASEASGSHFLGPTIFLTISIMIFPDDLICNVGIFLMILFSNLIKIRLVDGDNFYSCYLIICI